MHPRSTRGRLERILLQEPPLNDAKDVLGNIEEAVHDTKVKLARFNEIAEQMDWCLAEGRSFEIVPGVSSVGAAAAGSEPKPSSGRPRARPR